MRKPYFLIVYYLSWLVFGGVTVLLNVGSLPWVIFSSSRRQGSAARRVVRTLFESWTHWFSATGVMRLDWGRVPSLLPAGTIYVANHPSLLDATILLSRVTDGVCIVKPRLMRNWVVGPAAKLCGYVAGASMLEVVREASQAVAQGRSLVIFPEGTRTEEGQVPGQLKPGFALIASMAKAPVQVLFIETSPGLGRRGRAWWKPPSVLPARFNVSLGPRLAYREDLSPREITRWVAEHFQGRFHGALSVE